MTGIKRAGKQPKAENKLGSDCNGTDGDTNRVLTLANISLTSNESIIIQGAPLHLTADYTIVNNASGTEITFLNQLFDTNKIIINYFVRAPV